MHHQDAMPLQPVIACLVALCGSGDWWGHLPTHRTRGAHSTIHLIHMTHATCAMHMSACHVFRTSHRCRSLSGCTHRHGLLHTEAAVVLAFLWPHATSHVLWSRGSFHCIRLRSPSSPLIQCLLAATSPLFLGPSGGDNPWAIATSVYTVNQHQTDTHTQIQAVCTAGTLYEYKVGCDQAAYFHDASFPCASFLKHEMLLLHFWYRDHQLHWFHGTGSDITTYQMHHELETLLAGFENPKFNYLSNRKFCQIPSFETHTHLSEMFKLA